MKTTTKTMLMALAILMTTGLVLQSTHAASKAELAAKQKKLSEEALAKMTIKEVAPTTAAIAAMKTVKSKEWTVPTLAMKMNRIPAGTFKMGSPASEKFRHDDETLHNVTISKPFYMGVYEVTQAQFYKLMLPADFDHAGWTFYRGPFWRGTAVHYRRMPDGGFNSPVGAELQPDHPMECVTWPRAIDFCKKLNKIESKAGRLPAGYEYRLPTEAEWEYACRAGTNTPFNIAGAVPCFIKLVAIPLVIFIYNHRYISNTMPKNVANRQFIKIHYNISMWTNPPQVIPSFIKFHSQIPCSEAISPFW